VVIGAEKSGTSSLFYYLGQHPGIFMPKRKVLDHLIHHPEKRSLFQGPNITYAKACPSRDRYFQMFIKAPGESIVGEVSHIYLYAAESPELIEEVLGAPKIIAIIRNPLERAYAQFAFHRQLGIEPLATFEEATEVEQVRIKAGWDPVYHYVRRGFYGEQLSRYYRLFPASDIRIYRFEHFFQNLKSSLADLLRFIGADAAFVPDTTQKYIPGGDPRSYEYVASSNDGLPESKPIKPETRCRLATIYAEDIRNTERLTGLDLSGWLD
jgi:hypothetical protein